MPISPRIKKLLFGVVPIWTLLNCEVQQPNAGLYLPEGFKAVVVVDSIEERVRHLAVTNDGIVYGKLRNSNENGGIVALQDKNKDGRAEIMQKFGAYRSLQKWSYSTAMRIYNGYLYFSSELAFIAIN